MKCSTPGLPVHHQLPESTQTHVHWVGDDIQPSHPLSSPSPPAVNLSQHQGFFSNESALCIRWPKYWSFSLNISPSIEHPNWSPLEWTGWISLHSKGLSRVFSNTIVQKHQFFGAHLSSPIFFWGGARILEWVAIFFSRGSSRPRVWTQVSHIVGRWFTVWATREVSNKSLECGNFTEDFYWTLQFSSVTQSC